MFYRRLSLFLLFAMPALCRASDGVIHFTGRIIEPTCVVQTSAQNDKTAPPTLNACSKNVSSNTTVTTQIVTPENHMVPWRANDTTKPDVPVTQWKVIAVTYW